MVLSLLAKQRYTYIELEPCIVDINGSTMFAKGHLGIMYRLGTFCMPWQVITNTACRRICRKIVHGYHRYTRCVIRNRWKTKQKNVKQKNRLVQSLLPLDDRTHLPHPPLLLQRTTPSPPALLLFLPLRRPHNHGRLSRHTPTDLYLWKTGYDTHIASQLQFL